MYTGEGVGGKLVGLGQSDNEVIFAWAAASPCEDLDFDCVGETEFNNLANCFQGVLPPGVSRETFERWCRKARQCGLFDKPGCEPEMTDLVTERFGQIQECQSVDMYEVFSYCDEYGYGGPDEVLNTVCWTAHLAPSLTRQQRRRPSCEDAECLTERDVAVMGDCFMGDCPMPAAWFERMREKPVCPGVLGHEFEVPECLDADQHALMQYCKTHGYEGPDGASNAACWTLQRSDVYRELFSLRSCASLERIRQRLERARAEAAGAEAEAAEPPPPSFEPSPQPTPPAPPVYTDVPEPGLGPSTPDEPPPEPEPDRKVSMTTVGILAGVGLLAVGGIAWAASKGKG